MVNTSLLSRNALLSALQDADHEMLTDISLIDLRQKESVQEAYDPIKVVHFPLDAVISIVTILSSGTTIEVGTVGSEGTTGVPAALGASTMPNTAFCQVAGSSFVMSRNALERLLAGVPQFRQVVNAYAVGYLNVLAQMVACNGVHPLDARCARWLLMTHDRVGRPTFPLTQEFLSQMLGVRRSGVTMAASAFADAGFIRYSRGLMEILDRDGLESEACECYAFAKRELQFPK